VVGALLNSVFLVALCFTIFVEAIERLSHSHTIEQVDILLYVGIAGLIINVLGLFLFHGHGHSHGGHADPLADIELEVQGISVNLFAVSVIPRLHDRANIELARPASIYVFVFIF